MNLGTSWEGLRASWVSLGASWEGLRANWEGLRVNWEGPKASLEGPQSQLGGPQSQLRGPGFGRTDERTEFLPILQDFVPVAQNYSLSKIARFISAGFLLAGPVFERLNYSRTDIIATYILI